MPARRRRGSSSAIARAVETLEARWLLSADEPYISEFLTSNGTGILDSFGERSDWIEIHNPGPTSINLQNWRLTDVKTNLAKWTFPSTTLAANSYMVVFASERDRRISGQELHTNFNLPSGGGYLGLVRPNGTIASEYNPTYPNQVTDVSYGVMPPGIEPQTLVDEVSNARIFVPPNDNLGLTWTARTFPDAGWMTGDAPVGFDTTTSPVDFNGLIETNLQAQMLNQRPGAYVRIPFEVSDPAEFSTLTLQMRYDDGFAAYLNGEKIASARAPASPNANSPASSSNPDASAIVFESFNATAFLSSLVPGTNVLAIHGMNFSSSNGDFLLGPMLIGGKSTSELQEPTYYVSPTPQLANVGGALGEVKDTKFSVDRGYYDAPFTVAITSDTAGAEIRYTLDGTKPTATTGLVYGGPVLIDKTTTLRAAAFKPGFISTDVDAQTYIFLDQVLQQSATGLPAYNSWGHSGADWAMDPLIVNDPRWSSTIKDSLQSVPSLSLSMPWSDWFVSSTGIYLAGSGSERATSVELIRSDGVDGFQINGSVQIQGGTSDSRWKVDKLSMRLKFKDPYGPTKLEYDWFGGGAADDFDTLILDAVHNYSWYHPDASQTNNARYIQDQWMADLQNAMNGPGAAPHGKWVHLYINGLYWGLYDVHERPDESYTKEYFGGDKADWDILKHTSGTVVNGNNTKYNELLTKVRLDMTNAANYQAVGGLLDMEDFADYMILNFYGGNTDWAHHNWYASFNRVDPNGRWRFHSWDAEHVVKSPTENVTTKNDSGGPTEIHTRLRANPEYRQLFADRLQKHFFNNGVLTPANAAAYYQARMNEVDAAIVAESARWGDNRIGSTGKRYNQDNWRATQQAMMTSYFPGRTATVLGQLTSQSLYPATKAPSYSQHGGSFPSAQQVTIANLNTGGSPGTIYYTTDGSDPRLTGGAVSPTALVYTGSPVTISTSGRLRARVLQGATWSALNDATFLISDPPALRITEVMYNPAPPPPASPYLKDDFEFIELYNAGPSSLNLSGYTITDGVTFTFPQGASMAAGARAVVVRNLDAFRSRYGQDPSVLGVYFGELADSEDTLTLTTNLGQLIQQFTYDDGWYPLTDGGGYALVVRDPMAANLQSPNAWRTGNDLNGLPGQADPGHDPGAVVVSEVMTNPQSPAVDFIELHNTTTTAIGIGGWFLSDTAADLRRYQIPAGTTIPAGGFVVFNETQFGFGLSRSGEQVLLSSIDSAGNTGGYREEQQFGASAKDVSFGRYQTSTGRTDFVAMTASTPGGPNAQPLIGPVVINEIMYNPAASGPEFIELRNLTATEVPLYDPAVPANGWKFLDGITYTFASPASIPANGYALVVPIDPATFRSQYNIPAAVPIFGPYTAVLDNGGERVTLARPDAIDGAAVPYVVVDSVDYEDDPPWPADPDGTGPSLGRLNSGAYGSDVVNWAAEQAGGSPGVSNFGPAVASVTINDGHAQRSMITSITVTFDRGVSFDSDPFSLAGRDGAGTGMSSAWSNPSSDGRTWVIMFSGAGVIGGSLADGVYDLIINAAAVHAGGATMTADHTLAFHRLYSDADGDGDSDNADLFQMRSTYGKFEGDAAYRWWWDYESDGDVDNADVFQVRSRRTKLFQGY